MLTATGTLTVTGNPGEVKRYYFSMCAVGKDGVVRPRIAGKSSTGQDYLEFTIPWPPISDPFEVIFEVIVAPSAPATPKVKEILKGIPK